MNTHPLRLETLKALGSLICGEGEVGIRRGVGGIERFFSTSGLPMRPIQRNTVVSATVENLLIEYNRDDEQIKQVVLHIVRWEHFLQNPELFEPTLNRLQLILAPAGWTVEMDGITAYLRNIPAGFRLDKRTALPMEPTPEFSKINADSVWIKVLRARWDEAERCIAAEAPVMAIVALGSVLEGALRATAERNPKNVNQASASPKDPTSGKPKPLREWTFLNLIAVAEQLGWIGADICRLGHFSREYRNLVHPAEQVRTNEFPTQNSARTCRLAVLTALSDLIKWTGEQENV